MSIAVSVVVPIYNVELYLRKCLYSLAHQTMEGLEILLINDGSTDGSVAIAKEFLAKYPERFVYFEKPNGGLSDARNYGMERARGEYIGFVDSDDWVTLDMFETLYQKAVATNADMVLCGLTKAEALPPDDPSDETYVMTPFPLRDVPADAVSLAEQPQLLVQGNSYAWNKLYRKSLFRDIRYPVGQYYEDSAVTYNLMALARRIAFVDRCLYFYRFKRAGAITSANDKRIFDIFKSLDSIQTYYREQGLDATFRDELCELIRKHLFARIHSFQTLRDLPLALSFTHRAFRYLRRDFPAWRTSRYYNANRSIVAPAAYLMKWKECLFTMDVYIVVKAATYPLRLMAKRKNVTHVRIGNARTTNALPVQDLLEIQKEQRAILSTVDRFCAQNGLTYYLAEGSLLGAVRHQGFIPWDDDMDIAMPRKDYARFAELWGADAHEGCVLMSPSTYANHYLPFLKVVCNQNVKYTTPRRKAPKRFQGLGIDVFPLDECDDYATCADFKRSRRIRLLRDMMLWKVDSLSGGKRKLCSLLAGAPLCSMRSLQKRLLKACVAPDGKRTSCYVNHGSAYKPVHETFPKEWWGTPRRAPFDDCEFNVPQQAERILRRVYGDYMQMPPADKRVCLHAYVRKG